MELPRDEQLLLDAGLTADAVDDLKRRSGLSTDDLASSGMLLDFVSEDWHSRAFDEPELTLVDLGFTPEAEEELLEPSPYAMDPAQLSSHILHQIQLRAWKYSYGENDAIKPGEWTQKAVGTTKKVVKLWRSEDGKEPDQFPHPSPAVSFSSAHMAVEEEGKWTLYHGTTESAMRDIVDSGYFHCRSWVHDFFPSAAVYWTTDFYQALEHAKKTVRKLSRRARKHAPAVVMIEVPFSSLEEKSGIIHMINDIKDMPGLQQVQEKLSESEVKNSIPGWQKHVRVCRQQLHNPDIAARIMQMFMVVGPYSATPRREQLQHTPKGNQVAFNLNEFNLFIRDVSNMVVAGFVVFDPALYA